MKIEEKIKKKIKEKEKHLKRIKRFSKKCEKEEEHNLNEDFKFLNSINPFYKSKSFKSFNKSVSLTIMEVDTEKEINDLKELLKK